MIALFRTDSASYFKFITYKLTLSHFAHICRRELTYLISDVDAGLLNMLSFKKPLAAAINRHLQIIFTQVTRPFYTKLLSPTTKAARFRIISQPLPVAVSLPRKSAYVHHCRECRPARHNFHTKLRAKESLQMLQGKGSSSFPPLITGKKLQVTQVSGNCALFPVSNHKSATAGVISVPCCNILIEKQ